MVSENISEFYCAVCSENEIKINPHVLKVLQETTETENVTLKLSGSHHLRNVQRLDDQDILALSKCLKNNKSVTGLDLRYNNITDEGVGHLAELLQEESLALRSLDLMLNDFQRNGAEVLAKSLECNSTLLSLRLSGNKMESRGAMQLASSLQVNNTLQELQLADCDLDTQSVIAFSIVLKSNRTLLSVDISRPLLFSLQEEWAVHFSDMLALNSSLVELHLGKMGLSDIGMERLTEGLRQNHGLRYLDLRCNRVTRDGVRFLAGLLEQNPSLEVIDLSSNRIEDVGAMYLSEAVALPGCSLRELSVCCNNIGSKGLLSLAHSLAVSTTLSHLYIWGNLLEEPVCQAFRELTSSGRLPAEQTDVSAYEVDGRVFLAEVFQRLRKHYIRTNCSETDTSTMSNTAAEPFKKHASSTDSNFPPHTSEQRVPLQSNLNPPHTHQHPNRL
ncbi:hypothetical protein KUCAC02_017254 [Chaenocephalus aceratus]|uniref:Uncharacterized protein n=1 Tax=Chaenocephalus aceratus TaxID=36190 RepID=A0ACB9W212_CHAAC|nr:hypothetical protein KUCAC02_017254 [Chaenocephalus aceratus]